MSEETKKRGRDPAFMENMRRLAAQKKAEQKKISDAEKARKQMEHQTKLKDAETFLNPKSKEEVVEEKNERLPSPPKVAPVKEVKATNYKQEYYRHKLEMLKGNKETPNKPEPKNEPLPHKLLKQEFMNDINKTVMKELWTRHFGDNHTPYD